MPSLSTLLKKLEALHRQHVQVEHQIAEVKREIVAAGKSERPRRRKRTALAETIELIKGLLKVLRDTGEPLPRREIAARLGIAPSAVGYRLQKAIAAKLVERISGGRYRAANAVPKF